MGPPWSKRQLGVVFRETAAGGISLYYEPHADFAAESVQTELRPGDVDIVVTPVVNQELIAYPLVSASNLSPTAICEGGRILQCCCWYDCHSSSDALLPPCIAGWEQSCCNALQQHL